LLKRLILGAVLALGLPAVAQESPFAPVLLVGDRAITAWEVDQRALFLRLLRQPGDPQEGARRALIDDKLRLIEAARLGIELTPEQLEAGLTEFAGRANLTPDQFVAQLAEAGVAPETFRDFVAAGLVWREVVRARYAGLIQVTEAEIDRQITRSATQVSLRLLLSELVLPTEPGQEAAAIDQANAIRARIAAGGSFADAARAESASPSAEAGGAIDWLPAVNLPSQLTALLLPLAPGQVSEPVQVQGAVVLFQMRGIEETVGPPPEGVQLEWAEFVLPDDAGAAARVAEIRAQVDRCTDLYRQPGADSEAVLRVQTAPAGAVPTHLATALAGLDPNEITSVVDGPARVVVMLCQRSALPPPVDPEVPLVAAGEAAPDAAPAPAGPDRGRIREALLNQKLTTIAERDLGRLRAETWIREP
jgi:peptidyl-prolyl cis-trans isomerase SurA